MALLGDTIDPRLMVFDYSQDRSGEIMGNAIAGLGRDVGNEMDRRKKLQSEVKAGKTILKYAMERYPDEKPYLQSIAQEIDSPDLPLSDQAAMASRIADMIELGVGEQRYQKEFALRQQAENRAQREADFDRELRTPQIAAANRANNAAASAVEAEERMANGKLAYAIQTLSQNPALQQYFGSPESIQQYIDADPLAQSAIADKIMALAPERDKLQYTANFPMMVDGVPIEVPGVVNVNDGSFTPATVNGINGSDVGVNVDGGAGVLPPKPSVSIGKPVQTPGGLTEKQKQDIQKERLAESKAKQEVIREAQRKVDIIDTYIDPKTGQIRNKLDDTTGLGEGVGSFFGWMTGGTVGNAPETIANQKELTLEFVEGDILEAAKQMKPLSNDEKEFLKKHRPSTNDDPKVWAWYLKRVRQMLTERISTAYTQEDGTVAAPQQPVVDPMQGAGLQLQGVLNRNKQFAQ